MRIAFIGNFRPEHSTESDLLKTLLAMGHEVTPIQENDDAAGVNYPHDLLLWVHTNGWPWQGRNVSWVKMQLIPTVCFTLDIYRGLNREGGDVRDQPNMHCKYVVTADGSPETQAWFAEKGINHHYLPPGILRTSCYLAEPRYDLFGRSTLIFVGSEGYHPEWPRRKELLAWLRSNYGSHFQLYDHSSGMRGHKLNELYATAEIVVGDSCFATTRKNYTSDRLYESLGRGAVLVYPWIEGVEYPTYPTDIPDADRVCRTYRDFTELKAQIDFFRYWTKNSRRGQEARHSIVRWVRDNHSYTQRMQTMLDIVAKGEGWK